MTTKFQISQLFQLFLGFKKNKTIVSNKTVLRCRRATESKHLANHQCELSYEANLF